MLESKDPAIKLFGKKIAVPAEDEAAAVSGDDLASQPSEKEDVSEEETETEKKDSPPITASENTEQDGDQPAENGDSVNTETLLDSSNVNPKTPSIDEESAKSKIARIDKEQNDAGAANSQEKTLKKPDKILPCPRCNSMDTKFCYYNNYNVNQPRHFCKACQRYWTAGGTMRNMPVGAGRRKNKNSSHYGHITISEALQAARIEAAPPNGTHHHNHPALKSNGKVLSFGLDTPICDSMASVWNLTDNKKALNGNPPETVSHKTEERGFLGPCRGRENGDDCSSASSITVSNSIDEVGRNCPQEPQVQNINGFSSIPCLPGVPWPYPWNSAVPPPPPPPPPLCPPGFPMSFYPAAYWNCAVPGTWNIPWFATPQPSSPSQKSPSLEVSNSPTLGKHSRDGEVLKPDSLEREESSKLKNGSVVLVPKTLRINDPTEAAKSSIWATLGIKSGGISGGGMFKAFQSKSDEKKIVAEASPVLRANPAALSRSLKFHESS